MSIKIPRAVLFVLAYMFATALYWPALKGTPIWDDFLFWFGDPIMYSDTSYGTIFKNFAWPVSVSIQKFLISIWNKNYINYHILNLVLHFANAFLVYRMGRWLKIRHSFILFSLFLLHPVAVVSTAWMIQIKTLLCFFFALISVLFYLKGQKKSWWILAAWVFFTLSLLSKSASLVVLPVFIYLSFRQDKFKKLYFTIPFILISIWSAYRVIKSPVTIEASLKVEKVTALKLEEKPAIVEAVKSAEIIIPEVIVPEFKKPEVKSPEKKKEKKILKQKKTDFQFPPKTEITSKKKPTGVERKNQIENPEGKSVFKFDLGLFLQSLHYYFWQAIIPMHNEPIKGLNYQKVGLIEYLHLFFLFSLIVILWRSSTLFLFICGHLVMIPFLGFVSAPYMSITWVSDQHLYLALPLFLGTWVKIFEHLKLKFKLMIPALFLFAYCYKSYEAVGYYKNQFIFYESSLQYNPYNIPIACNLAYSYIISGNWSVAYNLLVDTYELAEKEPVMKNSFYYPHFMELYNSLKPEVEKHAM